MSLGFLPGLSDPTAWSDRLFARSGTRVFDVGANAGWVASRFAERFEHVVAFEPCIESFRALQINAERFPNMTAVNVAISSHGGSVTLTETAWSTGRWGELVTGEWEATWGLPTGSRIVPAMTLDYAARIYGEPSVVKVDVEGHEIAVLEGAAQTIAEIRPDWYVEVHRAEYEPVIRQLLDGYELEVIRHDQYPPDSENWHRHFWIAARPT